MNPKENVLIYGIGSHNGDDRLGWLVVEGLRGRLPNNWQAKSGLVPMDLLNHLEGVDTLHVIDACVSHEDVGTIHEMKWPKEQIINRLAYSSHDFSLSMTLKLAETLGVIPKQVTIWGIVGKAFEPNDSPSFAEQDFTNITEAIYRGICIKGNTRA